MRVEKLEEIIRKTMKKIQSAEELSDFLSFCGRGNLHNLSIENLILVYGQRPGATLLGTYEQWQKEGCKPLKGAGIAIYSFKPGKVQQRLPDHVFDQSGTMGRTIKVWELSEAGRESYLREKKSRQPGEGDFLEYHNALFLGQLKDADTAYANIFHGSDEDEAMALMLFTAECATKIYMERCGLSYKLSEESQETFSRYIIDKEGSPDAELFKACLAAAKGMAHKELQQASLYIEDQERRLRDVQGRTGTDSDGMDRSRGTAGGRTEGTVPEASRDGAAGGHGRGGSHVLSGTGEAGGSFGGSAADTLQARPEDSRLSDGRVSAADAEADGERRAGADAGREGEGSKGDVQPDTSPEAGRGERLEDGLPGEDSGREPDPERGMGGDRPGDPVPPAGDIGQRVQTVPPQSYHYPDGWQPNSGNYRMRFAANIAAIRTLKQVEAEGRPANPQEQEILSRYVGWGGLDMYFKENAGNLSSEQEYLKELLTPEEYKSALASVTDSFYTPRNVMKGIYQALERFGFKGGNVLEPCMGIGNFYSEMPVELEISSKLYGVELDAISGRISRFLHPNCNIQITGIEAADLQENFFDCVIGNVPFGEYKVYDKKLRKENFLIHDYFFAKALDVCAPGGIIAFVTSKGTLDKKNSSARKYISERAEFLGAIRLPNTTFLSSANTEVTSDIIFLKKKEALSLTPQEFETVEYDKNRIPVNSYYITNPDMMLGHMEKDTGRFGPDRAVSYLVPEEDADLDRDILAAVARLPQDVYSRTASAVEQRMEEAAIPADTSVKNFTYTVRDGKVYMRENSQLILQRDLNKATGQRIALLCGIREVMHELIRIQLDGCDSAQLQECQKRLNERYDAYVKDFGYINDNATRRVFEDDVEYTLLCALENPEDDHFVKAEMFSKQTIYPMVKREHTDTAMEALNITVADFGYVNMENVLRLYDQDFQAVLEELRGAVYLNPDKADAEDPYRGYETSEEYLSGDVRLKLASARIAAQSDARFLENVQALQAVLPRDLDASEIDVKIGVNWIEPEDYQDFIYEKFQIQSYKQNYCYLEYNPHINTYFIQGKTVVSNVEITTTYGTDRMGALEIFETLLNQRQVKVQDRYEDADGKVRYVLNQNATLLARSKADLIKEEFSEWLFSDMQRREKYVRLYNEKFNNIRLRQYDGSFLDFPGMNPEFALRPHQKNAVARIIRGGNTLLGHCVGAGYTDKIKIPIS